MDVQTPSHAGSTAVGTTGIKKMLLSSALVAASVCGLATADAAVVRVGSVDATADNNPEIDFYRFEVTTAGVVDFSVEAAGVGFMGSDLDSFLIVAVDDGTRSEDDIIDTNNNGGPGTDSFSSLFLDLGFYLLGVSSCCISPEEFVVGANTSRTFNDDNPVYRLTIEGNVLAVSSPFTLSLLGIGLAGVGLARRRPNVRRLAVEQGRG